MSKMIEVRRVTKRYNEGTAKESTALRDVSLTIDRNELAVLKGPSGSGKSTLLSLIAALQKPTSGEVVVDGERVSRLNEDFAALYRRRKVGFVFQKFHLVPTLTVLENVLVPLVPTDLPYARQKEMAERVMRRFSIAHKAERTVRELSGGEQQRVAIARALVNDPPLLLADEPTANLDAALSRDFLGFLEKIKAEGKTVVVATHDPIFFDFEAVDRTIELHDGMLVKG